MVWKTTSQKRPASIGIDVARADEGSHLFGMGYALAKCGKFQVSEEIKAKLGDIFYGGFCDDEATLETISDTFNEYGYLCDTHTAVAVNVSNQYKEKTGDTRPVLIASTASPYKFAKSVLGAVSDNMSDDEFQNVRILSNETNTEIPAPIAELENAKVRFTDIYEKENMYNAVCDCLGIK